MPGTGLAREASGFERFLWLRVLPNIIPLLRLLISANIYTPEESGAALAWLAISPDVIRSSGVYYEGRKRIKSSEQSYDEGKQEELWAWTTKTLSMDAGETAVFEIVNN